MRSIHRAPEEVRKAANRLRYRDFLIVSLIINRKDVMPDNWIYIHEPGVRVGRIQNFKNWSPHMVPDPNKTCLGMEYFVFENDDLWSSPDEKLIELAKREIAELGLAKPEEIEDGAVVRMPKAYPMYDNDWARQVATIRRYLETALPNLQLVGRNGMHKYNNQDHSMMTAMCAARNIMGANYDLWAINTEAEYHEEKQEKPATVAEVEPRASCLRGTFAGIRAARTGRMATVPVPDETKAAKAAASGFQRHSKLLASVRVHLSESRKTKPEPSSPGTSITSLVTGGAGFIGSHVVDSLLAHGARSPGARRPLRRIPRERQSGRDADRGVGHRRRTGGQAVRRTSRSTTSITSPLTPPKG